MEQPNYFEAGEGYQAMVVEKDRVAVPDRYHLALATFRRKIRFR
jgi:hypothetical protein